MKAGRRVRRAVQETVGIVLKSRAHALYLPTAMSQTRVQSLIRKVLAPEKFPRRQLKSPPPGAERPVYVTLTWKTEQGSATIKRIHFDHVEKELLNLLRRGLDATVWTEGENPREIGWVWINDRRGIQCLEQWD